MQSHICFRTAKVVLRAIILLSTFATVAQNAMANVLPNGGSLDADLTLGDIDTYTFTANVGDEVSIQVADTGDGLNTNIFHSPGAAKLGIEPVTEKSNRVLFANAEVFIEVMFSMHSPL